MSSSSLLVGFSMILLMGAEFSGKEGLVGTFMLTIGLLVAFTGEKRLLGYRATQLLFVIQALIAGVWLYGNAVIARDPVAIIYPITGIIFAASISAIYFGRTKSNA